MFFFFLQTTIEKKKRNMVFVSKNRPRTHAILPGRQTLNQIKKNFLHEHFLYKKKVQFILEVRKLL